MEVNITGYEDLNMKGARGYPLFWSSACDQTWEMRSVPTDHFVDGRSVQLGCKKTTVQLKNTSLCITLQTFMTEAIPRAFVRICKVGNVEEDQILLLCPGLESSGKDGVWSLMQYLPLYNSITVESALSINRTTNLRRVRLSTVDELKDLTKVACRDVKAENGTALLDVSVPVFLPGERITVECDEGFGVRGDNETYDNSYTTTCSEHMDLDLCSPLPKKREQRCFNREDLEGSIITSGSDRDLGTFFLVIVGLVPFFRSLIV